MNDDSFEERLRALARQVSRSLSETDLDDVAESFGVDPERVRGAAGAVENWLNERASEPLFGDRPVTPGRGESARSAPATGLVGGARQGPHPLDLPNDAQGRALSALDSGRWTVRAGAGRLASTDPGSDPAPPDDAEADVAGELRARDWITADGTVTVIGHRALLRWSRAADAGFEVAEPDS